MERIWELIAGDLKFYWALAIFGSLVLVIQLIISAAGFGADHDVDAGVGTHDVAASHADTGFSVLKLFSVQSVIVFVTFFGWGGVIRGESGLSGFFAALASGLFMMFSVSIFLFYLMKFQKSGNINPQDYVGCNGTVYLGIPADRTQSGKVTVNIRGCSRQITAVADEEIPTGSSVTVVQQIDGRRFLVKKIE